jgi:iron(III) transport system substrate-binding protein
MAASKNKADAKKFLDWTLSANAASLYGKYKELVTLPGFKPGKVAREAGMPEDPGTILYKMDFAASAVQRDAILARWNKEIGR